MQNFRKQMETHQIEYKEKSLGIKEMGLWRDRCYPHILPKRKWNLNLWENIREEAQRYFNSNGIAWHIQKHNLLSSQIMCVNIFFPLRQHLDILEVYLTQYLDGLEKVINLDFEYIGPPDTKDPSGYRNYFNETGGRGQNRTSSDIAITWEGKGNTRNMLLLEFKFTEPGFGECSQKYNHHPERCLSSKRVINSHQFGPTECYRTEVGRSYWDKILSSHSPFRKELLTTESYCPFRYDFYQLMRNQLLAHCVQSDPEEDFNKVDFGVIYYDGNEVLTRMSRPFEEERNPLKAWLKLLKNPNTFHVFTVQDFLNTIEPKLHSDLENWRAYLKQRYNL